MQFIATVEARPSLTAICRSCIFLSDAAMNVCLRPRVCKNTFLSCVLQPIAPGRGDFPIIYHDQRR